MNYKGLLTYVVIKLLTSKSAAIHLLIGLVHALTHLVIAMTVLVGVMGVIGIIITLIRAPDNKRHDSG